MKRIGFGFKGPYSGGKHQFMIKDDITASAYNPYQSGIGREQLSRISKYAHITKDIWENI